MATTKNLTYKIAQFYNVDGSRTLQSVLDAALTAKSVAISRREDVENSGLLRLINFNGHYDVLSVGELLQYTTGDRQPFANIADDATVLQLDTMDLPDGQEFVQGILYYAIFQNHVVVAQSMQLRAQQFEAYLNWLLREAGELQEGQGIVLADQPPTQGGGEAVIEDTSTVELAAPVSFEYPQGQVVPTTANACVCGPSNALTNRICKD